VFSAPCSQIPSICAFIILFLHTFSLCSRHRVLTHVLLCYQQPLLRNFQSVFSATCSHKFLSMSSQLPLLSHFQSVLNTVFRDTLFSDNACTSTYPFNMTHGLSKSRLLAMYEMHLYLLT
jgi:hypothetical protein